MVRSVMRHAALHGLLDLFAALVRSRAMRIPAALLNSEPLGSSFCGGKSEEESMNPQTRIEQFSNSRRYC